MFALDRVLRGLKFFFALAHTRKILTRSRTRRSLRNLARSHRPPTHTRPPRTVSAPNLRLWLCVRKPQKFMQYIASLVATCSVVRLKVNWLTLNKHCRVKMWNLSVNLQRFFLGFKSTVRKEYVVYWRALQICYSAILFMACLTLLSARSLAARVAITLNSFRTRDTESWKLQSVVAPPLENVVTPLYHKLSVALR